MEFEYIVGDIKTNIPWNRPTKKVIAEWYEEYKNIEGVSNYSLHIGGGTVNNKETWDVDLILLGKKENKNYREIRYILEESIKKGFDLKLLIDIFYKTALCTGSKTIEEHTKLKTWNKWSKKRLGVYTSKTYDESELISEGLWKYISIPKWTYKQMESKQYKLISMPIEDYLLTKYL